MSDDMIRALAAKGGVIQIAYEQSFLSEEFRSAYTAAVGDLVANRAKARAECGDDDACLRSVRKREVDALQARGSVPHVDWQKVVEHIEYVVRLVGVDHVGLGSDFDGASMPDGLEDCSKLPKITEALVRRGYSDRDIRKILGGNLLRVMDAAQRVARQTEDTWPAVESKLRHSNGAINMDSRETTPNARMSLRPSERGERLSDGQIDPRVALVPR